MAARAEKLFTPWSLPTAAPSAPSDRGSALVRALHLGAGALEARGHRLRVAGQQLQPGVRQPHRRVAVAAPPDRPVLAGPGLRRDPLGNEAAEQACLHVVLIGACLGAPSN